MKKLFTIAVLCLCMTLNAANLKFSSMLGDNMVLQQNATVKIWGYASPGASVSVSTSWGASGSARANAKGEWVATVKTPAVTFNPQTVRARSGSESVTASNVLIREVWFCSGQSNMQMTLGGGMGTPVEGSLEEIALSGQYKGVRHISIRNTSALEPAFDVEGEWQVSNPNTSPRFSAVAYFFASRLSKALDVPVGVINASWGGAEITPWMSAESLKAYSSIVNMADATDNSVNVMYKPTVMYNGMFAPCSKYTVNGIIWYQGESNVSIRYKDYASLMTTMVETWRKDFGRGDIPFLIVELPPYDYYDGNYGFQDEQGPILREQQFLATKTIPNSGIVGTNDLTYDYELNQVHPSNKRPVGERLCYLAMKMAYGYDNLPALNPSARVAYVDGAKVRVYFDNANSGWLGTNVIEGFELAGGGGHFHKADAVTGFAFREGAYVELTSKEVPEPKYVRYCFRDFQVGTLKAANGLPVIPFRAEVEPMPEQPARPAGPPQRPTNN